MRRISKNFRYVIDIIGTDLFTLEELGVGVLILKKKLRNFNLRTGRPNYNEIQYLEGTHVSVL